MFIVCCWEAAGVASVGGVQDLLCQFQVAQRCNHCRMQLRPSAAVVHLCDNIRKGKSTA